MCGKGGHGEEGTQYYIENSIIVKQFTDTLDEDYTIYWYNIVFTTEKVVQNSIQYHYC